MSFSDMLNDKITILKRNGEKIENQKASVQTNKIILDNGKILIESGDLVIRKMSNGGEETYQIIDPNFKEAFHSIGAHYQMHVKKLGLPEAQSAVNNVTYNFHGHNARVNNNSLDQSTNIVSMNVKTKIDELRAEIGKLEIPTNQKQEANEIIDAIEAELSLERPKRSVVSAFLKSLPQTANIASIGSFLIDLIK